MKSRKSRKIKPIPRLGIARGSWAKDTKLEIKEERGLGYRGLGFRGLSRNDEDERGGYIGYKSHALYYKNKNEKQFIKSLLRRHPSKHFLKKALKMYRENLKSFKNRTGFKTWIKPDTMTVVTQWLKLLQKLPLKRLQRMQQIRMQKLTKLSSINYK